MKWSSKLILIATLLLSSCGSLTESAPSIYGSVVDSDGLPVEGINIAVEQQEKRVDVYSAADGSFSGELPKSTSPNWNARIVGIDCTSKVMTNCVLTGYFELSQEIEVVVPLSEPVTFVFEKATTTIKGNVPVGGMRIFAIRSDGASSWGTSLEDGTFELPASDGTWDVYALDINTNQEGEHVKLEIKNGISDFVNLTIP